MKEVTFGLGIRGDVGYRLIDTRDGSVDAEGKVKNTIQKHFLNNLFIEPSYGGILDDNILYRCYLGDDNTPPTNSDNGLIGNELGNSADRYNYLPYNDIGSGRFRSMEEKEIYGEDYRYIESSPVDGIVALSRYEDNVITIYDVYSEDTMGEFIFNEDVVEMRFSKNGDYLAGKSDNYLEIYNTNNFQKVLEITDATGSDYYYDRPRGFSWVFGSNQIIYQLGSNSNILRIVDVTTGSVVKDIDSSGKSWGWRSLAFDVFKDGSKIAMYYEDDSIIYIVDLNTEELVDSYNADDLGDDYDIRCYNYDGINYIATWGNYYNDYFSVYDFNKGELIKSGTNEGRYCSYLSGSPDDRFITYCAGYRYQWGGGDPDRVYIYDLKYNRRYYRSHSQASRVYATMTDGILLSSSTSSNLYLREIQGSEIQDEKSIGYRWTFPPGNATGEIKEVAVRSNDDKWVARQVIEPSLIKEDYHQLEIEWKLTFKNDIDNYTSGVIEGGGRNLEDITWEGSIGNMTFHDLLRTRILNEIFSGGGDHIKVILGNSNDNSNWSLKGDLIPQSDYISDENPFHFSVEDYVQDSFERTFRIGLDTEQGNMIFDEEGEDVKYDIGELIITYNDVNLYNSMGYEDGFGRFTFTPKLNKIDTFRLYIDFTFRIEPI